MRFVSMSLTLLLLSWGADEAHSRARSFEARCDELAGRTFRVPGTASTTVVEAQVELVDPQQSEEPVEHCHVIAESLTVSDDDPSDRSTIRSSIRLPQRWNRRLMSGGAGGLAGDLAETETRVVSLRGTMLQQRYATVFNDGGHMGAYRADASWALDVSPSPGIDNQKELNWAIYSTHYAALTAKKVVRAFYQRPPQYAYFQGCSGGGRQGLIAATLFPRDFDGILVGAPAQPMTTIFSRMARTQQSQLPILGELTEKKMEQVTSSVLAKCDADDGVLDGILDDPRRCDFDPFEDLTGCPGDVNGPDCFTAAQREFIALNYSNVTLENPDTTAFGFQPSSERGDALSTMLLEGWSSWITGTPVLGGVGLQFILDSGVRQFMVFDDPAYDHVSYLTTTTPSQLRQDALVLESLDPPKPDLTRFQRRGGKLILYHGWIDPSLAPEQTIQYFDDIALHTSGRRDGFARLFMIPGMAHCEFGPGAQVFDGIGAIRRWVERGQAPNALNAEDLDATFSRPLCKYPSRAVYRGGDPSRASSFRCR